jgi:hypothetical protein
MEKWSVGTSVWGNGIQKSKKYQIKPNGMIFACLPVATLFGRIIDKTCEMTQFGFSNNRIRIEPALLGYQEALWSACRLNLYRIDI